VIALCGSGGKAFASRVLARSEGGLFVPDDSVVKPVSTNASAANDANNTATQTVNVNPERRLQARATDVVDSLMRIPRDHVPAV
jgi:hypothetical protein